MRSCRPNPVLPQLSNAPLLQSPGSLWRKQGAVSIRGLKAKELSAERTTELMQVMKAFTRDWGIAFDVEVTVAPGNTYALVARFSPRDFFVHDGRRLSSVMSNAIFRARAKALYQAVAADLKARCAEAFAIENQADLKIRQGLKDELACVVRNELEGVEAFARSLLATGRKLGLKLAVRFFEHYLGASGSSIALSREEALEFDLITNAATENVERFKERNFISTDRANPAFSAIEEITKNPKAEGVRFQDHWKVDFNASVLGIARFLRAAITDPIDTTSARFGPGESSLISCGGFELARLDDRILVSGTITRLWTDDGFNFDQGKSFHEEAQILEKHRKARPFKWEARWSDIVDGELLILVH